MWDDGQFPKFNFAQSTGSLICCQEESIAVRTIELEVLIRGRRVWKTLLLVCDTFLCSFLSNAMAPNDSRDSS